VTAYGLRFSLLDWPLGPEADSAIVSHLTALRNDTTKIGKRRKWLI